MTKAPNENKIPLTATMPSFAPSASKSHDKGAKREQNHPYSHYNGLNSSLLFDRRNCVQTATCTMWLPHFYDYILAESALVFVGRPTRDSMLHRNAAQAAEDGSEILIRRFWKRPTELRADRKHNSCGIALRHCGPQPRRQGRLG